MTDSYQIAKEIVIKLTKAGHLAYFAGGWVRDFVMGHPSEDIDIATDATPAKLMDLFPQTVLVGLAFGVVIVVVEGHSFEVATFRKDLEYLDGRHPQGIELSTPYEDALRRDFTINGMFYDPIQEVIHDYVHGQEDIKRQVIRTIGKPHERFFEDRLRMLRAFRFAARFGFHIDIDTQEAIRTTVDSFFPAVAMERVWQEFNKMASYPRFDDAVVEMHRLGLLDIIFPELSKAHIKEMRNEVKAYSQFPKNTPTILYIMELFPHLKLEEKLDVVKRLKASNDEIKLIEFMERLNQAILKEEKNRLFDKVEWCSLFSHPHCELGLQIYSARFSREKKELFLKKYQDYYQTLLLHINRTTEGRLIVTSQHLIQKGIQPGKQMGLLLKEGEKIAINENIDNPDVILEKLQRSMFWKNNS
ncbi:MAG: CCA tRNA nucleotidyltransferase [Parachlamydiaceae bacterium]|nr:CCA tRNA nucleotidyltransferase [Parachlamydiaceae bacterium]